jgi:hypothetical protein
LFYKQSFEIGSLNSEVLNELFDEVAFYAQGLRIEIASIKGNHLSNKRHPAATIGLTIQNPTIRFVDSLNKEERIEAIAHELVHLLLIYKFALRIVSLKFPCPGDSDGVFKFCMNMNKDWNYILGQIVNTAHHIILIDYLKEEFGIESSLHLQLLHHHFCRLAREGEKENTEQILYILEDLEYDMNNFVFFHKPLIDST